MKNIKKIDEKELKKVVNKLLLELGVSPHTRGFSYILEGVCLAYYNRELLYQVVKGLYYNISLIFNNTFTAIERAIRYSIERAYLVGNLEKFDEVFGYTINPNKDKPTNSQFIGALVNYLDINL